MSSNPLFSPMFTPPPETTTNGNVEYSDSLATVFADICTPPGKAKQTRISDIILRVNAALAPCGYRWEILNKDSRAKIGYFIMQDQDLWLESYLKCTQPSSTESQIKESVAVMLLRALGLLGNDKLEFLRGETFLQREGDVSEIGLSAVEEMVAEFHKETGQVWKDSINQEMYSIYEDPNAPKLQPFVRFQTEYSTACWIIAGAGAILNFMAMKSSGLMEFDECVAQYAINAGRYMRGQLTPEEIFCKVFLGNRGYPDDFLEKMLTTCQFKAERAKRVTHVIALWKEFSAGTLYEIINVALRKTGAIVVSDFVPFPDYQNNISQVVFSGEWENLKPDPTSDLLHAFLIVGVRRVGSRVEFLVQDSVKGRPFVVFDSQLLKDMGVTFFCIDESATFSGTSLSDQVDYPIPASLTSGGASPAPSVMESLSSLSGDSSKPNLDVNRVKPDFMGLDLNGYHSSEVIVYSL